MASFSYETLAQIPRILFSGVTLRLGQGIIRRTTFTRAKRLHQLRLAMFQSHRIGYLVN